MNTNDIPFRLMNWALLWSPLQGDDTLMAAWKELGLTPPLDDELRHGFVKTFFLDLPQPKMPLTFSNALQRESGACHEDWMRISQQLGLERAGPVLPPDHLALACELLVHAWAHEDDVLLHGIHERYLAPWLALARERLDSPLIAGVIASFDGDLQRVCMMA